MTTITSVSGSSGVQQTSQNSNARLQAAIARLVGLPGIFPAGDSVATLSTIAQLQAQNADIRRVSANIVQAYSLSQVADTNVSDIEDSVQQLQALARRAESPTLDEQARTQLNDQFQQLVQRIDVIARTANFNGKALLDGSLNNEGALSLENAVSGDEGEKGSGDLSIAELTSNALFNGAQPNVLTSDNASKAVDALSAALDRLATVRTDISIFQKALDYASASLDSVQANQVAAESIIREGEFTTPAADDVQRNAANAVIAQTNQLSPKLLQLIG